MLIVLSPSKTLDTEITINNLYTQPEFLTEAQTLNNKLKRLSKKKLKELMNLSPQLADLNHERNHNWALPFTPDNAKTAVHTFQGDVYLGLNVKDFTKADLAFAQQHLRILSGLYGVLRPLDLIQPYRLEMGSALKTRQGSNLLRFWGDKITQNLEATFREQTDSEPVLINLASNEYFKAVVPKKLNVPIITPVFKEQKGETYKVIGFLAKKARGLMARYLIKNQITDPEEIKSFEAEGYEYNPVLSNENEWVFTRSS